MAQVNIFLKAIEDIEKRKMQWDTIAIRSQHFDKETYNKMIKNLEE